MRGNPEDIKKNNLNNLYNNEQRFARILPLRGPCRLRAAARETTSNNASPRTRFLLVVLAKLFHFMALFLAMAKHERARFCAWLIESVACCFPYSARWHFPATKAIFCSKSRMDQKKSSQKIGARHEDGEPVLYVVLYIDLCFFRELLYIIYFTLRIMLFCSFSLICYSCFPFCNLLFVFFLFLVRFFLCLLTLVFFF